MTTLQRIRAEIEQIIPIELPYGKNTPENIRDMALEIIDKYAEQEPKVTTTSTDEPMVMQYPQVDGITPTLVFPEEYTKYDMWIGEKQEPCDDAISREELLKAIDTWDKFGCNADTKLVPYQDHYIPYIHYDDVVKCIKGMPSVRPQEQTGHWIDHQEGRWIYAKCSECETVHDTQTNYCPNCGVRMYES